MTRGYKSVADLAWTAGIIDGDGCISRNTTSSTNATWRPLVVVDSTDLEILQELARIHGGGNLVKKRSRAEHHRQAWSWRMYGALKVIAFLTEIYPYMRCEAKRARAELLITRYADVTPRNGHYTPELRAAKIALGEELLNIGAGRGSGGIRRVL